MMAKEKDVKMSKSRYFWLKSNGTVEEISFEKYQKLAFQSIQLLNKRKLVAVLQAGFNFFESGIAVWVPRKQFNQLLKILESEETKLRGAGMLLYHSHFRDRVVDVINQNKKEEMKN